MFVDRIEGKWIDAFCEMFERCAAKAGDTNGTELRAVAGNFLLSTGANELAGRYTAGHFPVMRTTTALDSLEVVKAGVLRDVFT